MVYQDYEGRQVRLPDERIAHILRNRPYIIGMEWAIRETLEAPQEVRQSSSDPTVSLYYRWILTRQRVPSSCV
jgi:hypothetical protein